MPITAESLITGDALEFLITRKNGKLARSSLKARGVVFDDGKDGEAKITEVRDEFAALQNTLNTFLQGDADGGDLDRLKELVAAINANKGSIDALVADHVRKSELVNDLTTGGADKALAAEQGKALKGLIDALSGTVGGLKAAARVVTELPEDDGWPSDVAEDGILFYAPAPASA